MEEQWEERNARLQHHYYMSRKTKHDVVFKAEKPSSVTKTKRETEFLYTVKSASSKRVRVPEDSSMEKEVRMKGSTTSP